MLTQSSKMCMRVSARVCVCRHMVPRREGQREREGEGHGISVMMEPRSHQATTCGHVVLTNISKAIGASWNNCNGSQGVMISQLNGSGSNWL